MNDYLLHVLHKIETGWSHGGASVCYPPGPFQSKSKHISERHEALFLEGYS